jgi:hypothetical protein
MGMRNYLFVFSFLLCCSSYGQSKIDKSKNDLNGRNQSSRQNSNDRGRPSNSQNSGTYFNNEDGGFWVYVIPKIVFFSFIGNHRYEQHLQNKVTDYPYYNGESGNYENSDFSKNFRLDIEDNLLFSSNTLYGNHLKVKIRPFQYFYLQSDMHQLFEKNKLENTTDRLSVYFFNAGYDRIRMRKFNFGWTMGASYIGNEVKKGGFSFGLNTELFLSHSLSVSAAAKWSSINGYSVNLYDIQTRYHKERFFGSLGFEHMQIGTPNYNFVSLGGGIYLN